jgi:hypothetical protein
MQCPRWEGNLVHLAGRRRFCNFSGILLLTGHNKPTLQAPQRYNVIRIHISTLDRDSLPTMPRETFEQNIHNIKGRSFDSRTHLP